MLTDNENDAIVDQNDQLSADPLANDNPQDEVNRVDVDVENGDGDSDVSVPENFGNEIRNSEETDGESDDNELNVNVGKGAKTYQRVDKK